MGSEHRLSGGAAWGRRHWRLVAVAGVLVAIVGTVVIWVFLSDLEDTTDRSLLIGEQATVTLNEIGRASCRERVSDTV